MILPRQAQLFICAVQFLTRLPTPTLPGFQPDWISRSARYFPLVGQLVGLLAAAVWLASETLWPGWPAAVLALLAGMLTTGGFHEDGLADTADGLGGGQNPQQRLAIMKDSRVGSFGALALIGVIAIKAALLARLGPLAGALSLILANGGARSFAVMVMAIMPYAGDPEASKIKPAPQGVRWPEAALAAVIGFWPLLLFQPRQALIGLVLAGAFSAGLCGLARWLIKGITGDVLGAVEQLAEVGLMMGAGALMV